MKTSLYEKLTAIEKRHVLVAGVVALAWICLFFELGGVPLLGKDEPRYAEVAREMYVSGDWITPRLAGHVWFEKPALPYWLMAAAYSLFGVSEFSARLGSALLGAAGVATVFLVTRRAAGYERAAISAVVLATSGLWFAFARGASFDMPLAATMTLALGAFYAFDSEQDQRKRLGWAVAAGAAVGGAMLAKGLVGPLLVAGIVGIYLLVTGRWRSLRPVDLLAAILSGSAVAAVWYWPVWQQNGWAFVEEFFVNHHFRRYLTNRYHHPQPIYFYLLIVLAGVAPWTLFLIPAVKRSVGTLRRRPTTDEDRLVWLAVLWVMVPLAFFSLSTSKLPGYILPVFPAAALLVGGAVHRSIVSGERGWALPATGVVVVGLGGGLAAYGMRSLGAPLVEGVILFSVVAASGLTATVLSIAGRRWAGFWTVAGGTALVVVLIAGVLFGEIAREDSLKALSLEAKADLRAGEKVLLFGVVEYGPAFYTDGRMVVDDRGQILVATSFDQAVAAIRESPTASVLCITDEAWLSKIAESGQLTAQPLGSHHDRVLARLEAIDAGRNRRSAPPDGV